MTTTIKDLGPNVLIYLVSAYGAVAAIKATCREDNRMSMMDLRECQILAAAFKAGTDAMAPLVVALEAEDCKTLGRTIQGAVENAIKNAQRPGGVLNRP